MVNKAEEMLNQKGALKVPDKKELADILLKIDQDLQSNMPFYLEQFERATDKMIKHGKSEIDSFITQVVQETGLKALKENRPTLLIEEMDDK